MELTKDTGKPDWFSCHDGTAKENWRSPQEAVASLPGGGSWVAVEKQAGSWEEDLNLECERMGTS